MQRDAPESESCTGIVSGSGSLPFAVADQLAAQGRRSMIFGLRGFCDPQRIVAYPHRWIALGQLGRLVKVLRREQCRDVTFIGGVVRPSLSEIRLDLGTLRAMPQIIAAFRGGDNRLLTGIGRLLEAEGFRMVGLQTLAPALLMPEGCLTRRAPDEAALTDIKLGTAFLQATGPFDVGQGVIVIDGNIVCVEDIGGTDAMLARAAQLRAEGRLRAKAGRGVLVKAPKAGQDLRYDLPTFGTKTIAGLVNAGLAGAAVTAGKSLMPDAQDVVEGADKAGLFVVGLPA